ncbi:hypothetical protein [Maribacter luteus]|uniref:hypothetical protein n=1 Tax=Maribacter luteus TaxID=2594478 RepID=UPI002492BB6D|nr:hypothetical protein [Maribacter luteus]
MKNVRKKVIAVFFSIIILGCGHDSFDVGDGTSQLSAFSGEELFYGIFFSKGEVAEMIPVVRNSQTFHEVAKYIEEVEGAEEFDKATSSIIKSIQEKNQTYFADFAQKIKSGNHLLIKDALLEGADLLYNTSVDIFLSELGKQELEELANGINISDHLNADGSVNYESLKEVISSNKINEAITNESKALCAVLGPVFVAVAYLLVVHAASVASYVYLAWVYNSYSAIEVSELSAPISEITLEQMVNDLANPN